MKTDIMEYVEKIWSVPLMDCQKEFLREAYEAAENNMRLIYYPPRGENRFQLVTLMALATILIAEERGVLKITDRQYSKTPIIIGRNSFRKE